MSILHSNAWLVKGYLLGVSAPAAILEAIDAICQTKTAVILESGFEEKKNKIEDRASPAPKLTQVKEAPKPKMTLAKESPSSDAAVEEPRAARKRLPQEVIDKVRKLYQEGLSDKAIGKQVGGRVGSNIHYIRNKYGITRDSSSAATAKPSAAGKDDDSPAPVGFKKKCFGLQAKYREQFVAMKKDGNTNEEIAKALKKPVHMITRLDNELQEKAPMEARVKHTVDSQGRAVKKCPPAYAMGAYPQRSVGVKA